MASELVLLEQWRERLKRQSESGLTVEAFCQKEGVSTSMSIGCGPRQLAVPRPPRCSAGQDADVQRRQQCPSASPGDRGLLG